MAFAWAAALVSVAVVFLVWLVVALVLLPCVANYRKILVAAAEGPVQLIVKISAADQEHYWPLACAVESVRSQPNSRLDFNPEQWLMTETLRYYPNHPTFTSMSL